MDNYGVEKSKTSRRQKLKMNGMEFAKMTLTADRKFFFNHFEFSHLKRKRKHNQKFLANIYNQTR